MCIFSCDNLICKFKLCHIISSKYSVNFFVLVDTLSDKVIEVNEVIPYIFELTSLGKSLSLIPYFSAYKPGAYLCL